MKVIAKSYYKNSSIFKEGEYVKPIPSSASNDKMDSFLKEKMLHETLSGNYSPSELKYIQENLSDTIEYIKAKEKKLFNGKTILVILVGLIGLYVVFKLISAFFGWLIFLSVIALVGYPVISGNGLPNINKYVAVGLVALWIVFGNSGISNPSDAESLVGNRYNIDEFHVIGFTTSSRYFIYQEDWRNDFLKTCSGGGNWSVKDEKVIIGSNDSGRISTSEKRGIYSFSDFDDLNTISGY